MTLYPHMGIIDKIIDSWKGYSDLLPEQRRIEFGRMMNKLYRYRTSIEVKAKPFENDPIFMALMIEQENIISWLHAKVRELESKKEKKKQKGKEKKN